MASEKQLVDLDFNGDSRATNLLDPSGNQDAATKKYVDDRVNGLDWKASVRVATTAPLTLATDFENNDVIDGVTLVTGNRILIKNQAAGAENGIYTVNASGAPTRATDADSSSEVTSGMTVWVTEGSTQGDSAWTLTTDDPIVVGTTALVFTQSSGTGQITAGSGLTKTGNTINVGAGTGITVNPDDVALDTTLAARWKTATIGDGVLTTIDYAHNLNNQWATAMVKQASTPWARVHCRMEFPDANTVRMIFNTAPATNSLKVTVVG